MNKSYALNLGWTMAAISIVIFLTTAIIQGGMVFSFAIGVIALAIMIGVPIVFVRRQRSAQNGVITFKEVFYTAFIGLAIGGVIYMAFSYIYVNYIDPGYLETMVNQQIETTSKFMKGMAEADMIEALSGEQHTIRYMTETEAELGKITPDSSLIIEDHFDAFFYVGAGYETFIGEFTKGIDKNKVSVVNISRGIDILRHKINKIDMDNYYYLMNSTNFKIALNSIKNSLQEMDPANKVKYDENFLVMSERIDLFQREIKEFMQEQDQIVFITDTNWPAYVVADYHKDYQLISEFVQRKTTDEQGNNTTTASADSNASKEKRLFLFSDDLSLQKYADDLIKYSLIPVKISLYDSEHSVINNFRENFNRIKKAIQPED